MKTGICTGVVNASTMLKSAPDYIEISVANLAQMSEEEFAKYKNFIAENGLRIEAANCFFPGNLRLCGKEFDITAVEKYTKKALERLADLKIGICVIGSGKSRTVQAGEDFQKCYADFSRVCRMAGDIAKEYSITICIEPLNQNETNMITTVKEGASFVRELNHPSIRLLADFYHMAVENEPIEVFYENRDIIAHVHVANPDQRNFPLETDDYDYVKMRDILIKSGYDKRISIEASGKSDFKSHAEKSVLFIKKLVE